MKRFWLLLCLCWPLAALADAAQSFRERLAPLESLRGAFTQVLTDDKGQPLQTSQGSFALKRPGYFLWQSKTPYEQSVIGTPDRVWVYDPDLEQVTIHRRDPADLNNPARLLTGDLSELRTRFAVSQKTEGGVSAFVLTPLAADTPYREVQVAFDGSQLSRLSFVDKLNQQTLITFRDTEQNQALPDTLFQFEPPPGTDIIVDE